MEQQFLYLVYNNHLHTDDKRRPLQRVQLERLAVFTSLEEAEQFIKLASPLDMHKCDKDERPGYSVNTVPYDPPQSLYEQMLSEDDEDASDNNSTSWDALPNKYWTFNNYGALKSSSDLIDAEWEAEETFGDGSGLFANCTPELSSGDVIHIRDWYLEDMIGVVAAIHTKRGHVRKFEETDQWLGGYSVVVILHSGVLDYTPIYMGKIPSSMKAKYEILPQTYKLPDRLKLLELFSQHFKGELELPEDLLPKLVNENPFVENVEGFPFDLFE